MRTACILLGVIASLVAAGFAVRVTPVPRARRQLKQVIEYSRQYKLLREKESVAVDHKTVMKLKRSRYDLIGRIYDERAEALKTLCSCDTSSRPIIDWRAHDRNCSYFTIVEGLPGKEMLDR